MERWMILIMQQVCRNESQGRHLSFQLYQTFLGYDDNIK